MKDQTKIARLKALIAQAPADSPANKCKWVADQLRIKVRTIHVWRCPNSGMEVSDRSLLLLEDAVKKACVPA